MAWPCPEQFLLGQLCCDSHELLIFAEYKSNDRLVNCLLPVHTPQVVAALDNLSGGIGSGCMMLVGLSSGRVTFESIIYSFGTVFLHLLSGKHIPPSQVLDMIRGKSLTSLLDSHQEGKFSTEPATIVVDLAYECLPRERFSTKEFVVTLALLQTRPDFTDEPWSLLLSMHGVAYAISFLTNWMLRYLM